MSEHRHDTMGVSYFEPQRGQTDPDPLLKVLSEIGRMLQIAERERDSLGDLLDVRQHQVQSLSIELSQRKEDLTRMTAEVERFRGMNRDWRSLASSLIAQAPRTRAARALQERLTQT